MSGDPISEMAHLFRRAGFGAGPEELAAAMGAGYEATVERLITEAATAPPETEPPPPQLERVNEVAEQMKLSNLPADQRLAAQAARQRSTQQQFAALHSWWLARMASSGAPLRERLTLFWHNHFATGISKVRSAAFMFDQNELFRTKGLGAFPDLVQAVGKDPAMLIWLDSNSNRKGAPNENFARELMELFTLGVGHYSEEDVRQAARTFTGWTLNRQSGTFAFNPRLHDGDYKTVLGRSGDLSGEDVISLVSSRPESSSFIASKLFRHLAHTQPPPDTVQHLAGVYESGSRVIAPLVREILLSPEFRGDDSRRSLVRQPADWVASSIRALGLGGRINEIGARSPRGGTSTPNGPSPLFQAMAGMGQTLFEPPNVGGWGQNAYWLTTAAAQVHLQAALAMALSLDHPEALLETKGAMAGSDAPSPSAALLARLGSPDSRPETVAALESFRKAGASSSDPRPLIALALTTPDVLVA
jgi:uncharacterized protein (DUF1800 family)